MIKKAKFSLPFCGENLIKIKFPRDRVKKGRRGSEWLKRLDRKVIKTIKPRPNQNYYVLSVPIFLLLSKMKFWFEGEQCDSTFDAVRSEKWKNFRDKHSVWCSCSTFLLLCDKIDKLFLVSSQGDSICVVRRQVQGCPAYSFTRVWHSIGHHGQSLNLHLCNINENRLASHWA